VISHRGSGTRPCLRAFAQSVQLQVPTEICCR
jgi:hypothetical protein